MRSLFSAAIVLLASSPAVAADGPEAVYMKFHRAGLEADVKTMRSHSSEAQQGRAKTDADAKEQAQKLQSILPSSYAVTGRAAGSTRVVLNLHGTGGGIAGDGGAAAGKVTLIKEGEAWKVDRVEWLPHGGASAPQPAARPPVDAYGAPTSPPPRSGTPPSAPGAPGSAAAPAAAAPAAAAPRRPSPGAPPPPPPPSGKGFNPASQRPPGMGEPPR